MFDEALNVVRDPEYVKQIKNWLTKLFIATNDYGMHADEIRVKLDIYYQALDGIPAWAIGKAIGNIVKTYTRPDQPPVALIRKEAEHIVLPIRLKQRRLLNIVKNATYVD